MPLPAKSIQFATILFMIAFCLPFLQAQVIVPALQEPYDPMRARSEGPLLRGALVDRTLPQMRPGDVIELLSTPVFQRMLALTDEQRNKIERIGFDLQRTGIQQETAFRSLSDAIAVLTEEQRERLRQIIWRLRQQRLPLLSIPPATRPSAPLTTPQK